VVLAKLDSTARGGIVLAIARELELPVRFVGTGEHIGDLAPFDAELFVDGLLRHP
jgi:fused signal recognition particle receptor